MKVRIIKLENVIHKFTLACCGSLSENVGSKVRSSLQNSHSSRIHGSQDIGPPPVGLSDGASVSMNDLIVRLKSLLFKINF